MKASHFKNKLKEIKDFLRGKEIILKIVDTDGIHTLTFNTLKAFGNKILELENKAAGFSFVSFGNSFIEKRVITESELSKYLSRGVWTRIHISASTINY